jgi:hypothetical protein
MYHFDLTISNMSEGEADELLKIILSEAEWHSWTVGGGFTPIQDQEGDDEDQDPLDEDAT